MVYGNSRHYTHECGSARNSTAGHGKLYAVREAGHHITSTHRIQGETGNLEWTSMGSSDTKDGPETCIQGKTSSSLSQNLAPMKTSDDLVWILARMVIYVVNQRRISLVLDDNDFMFRTQWKTYQDRNRKQLVGNYLEVF
jgi:hypothetical protein